MHHFRADGPVRTLCALVTRLNQATYSQVYFLRENWTKSTKTCSMYWGPQRQQWWWNRPSTRTLLFPICSAHSIWGTKRHPTRLGIGSCAQVLPRQGDTKWTNAQYEMAWNARSRINLLSWRPAMDPPKSNNQGVCSLRGCCFKALIHSRRMFANYLIGETKTRSATWKDSAERQSEALSDRWSG